MSFSKKQKKRVIIISVVVLVLTLTAILVPVLLLNLRSSDPFESVEPVNMDALQKEFGSLRIYDHFLQRNISYFQGPRTAYLLMAHNENTIRGLYELLKAIYRPYNLYVFHLDKKIRADQFSEAKKQLLAFTEKDENPSNNIVILEGDDRIDVKWGDWTIVQAELNLLKAANAWNGQRSNPSFKWEMAINLCGESYLMRSMVHVESSLAKVLKEKKSDFLWFGKFEKLMAKDSKNALKGDYYRTISKFSPDFVE